jgi:hypothetical protein
MLRQSIGFCESVGDLKQSIFARSMLGRALLLCGDVDGAIEVLDTSVDLSQRLWTAFLPWPQALRAEAELLRGHIGPACELFEQAFALGCQLGDPCWEGMAATGLGRVAMVRGQPVQAAEILLDALKRCARLPDGYLWGKGYALDALCRVATEADMPQAKAWGHELMALAAGAGMRELVVRAYLHQAAGGQAPAASAAQVLANEIDNPRLLAQVQGAGL